MIISCSRGCLRKNTFGTKQMVVAVAAVSGALATATEIQMLAVKMMASDRKNIAFAAAT